MAKIVRGLVALLPLVAAPAVPATSAESWREEAVRRIHDGRFLEAEEVAGRAGERETGPAPAFFQALASYWRLLYDPDDPGLQAEFDSRLDRAIRAAERRLAEVPGDAEGGLFAGTSRLFLAELRAKQRRPLAAAHETRRARRALERALAAEPGLADARFGLGTIDVVAGRASSVARGLAALAGLSGNSARGLEHLSVAARDGRILALESQISLLTVHSNRRAPDFAEAERRALAMSAQAPSVAALEAAARVLLAVGAPDRAADLLDAALARAAAAPLTDRTVLTALRVARARAALALFRPDHALEDLRSIPIPPGALPRRLREEASELARDAAAVGARPEWLPDLAADLDFPIPGDAASRAAARSFGRAVPALDLESAGALAEAAARLDHLAGFEPGDAVLAALAGRASLLAGRDAAARRWLDRAISSDLLPKPWAGPCLLLAGMAADLEGDRPAALALYRRAAQATRFASRDAAALLQERPYRRAS